jgi:hypothetical protein
MGEYDQSTLYECIERHNDTHLKITRMIRKGLREGQKKK